MAAALSAITEHVHFAQTDLVNWTLVTDGARVMLIDAGFPGQREDVIGSVRQLGFTIDDIAAVLLTHAHIDHFGTAIWLAKTMAHQSFATRPNSGTPSASTSSRPPRPMWCATSGSPAG